jgi:hypothetical protein
MPKKIPGNKLITIMPTMKMKYKDLFDLASFYEYLKEWYIDHEWSDDEDGKDHWETNYGERITSGGVKEIWFWWRLTKKAPQSSYLKYYVDMDFHVLGLSDAEIIRDGNKFKVNKGEINIEINAFIEKTFESKFDKNFILKQIKSLFTRRIYRKNLENRKRELYQEIYQLNNFIKQWFKLRRYLPYEESKGFFKSYAWPSHVKDS